MIQCWRWYQSTAKAAVARMRRVKINYGEMHHGRPCSSECELCHGKRHGDTRAGRSHDMNIYDVLRDRNRHRILTQHACRKIVKKLQTADVGLDISNCKFPPSSGGENQRVNSPYLYSQEKALTMFIFDELTTDHTYTSRNQHFMPNTPRYSIAAHRT